MPPRALLPWNRGGGRLPELDAVVKEFEAVRRRLGLGQQGGGGGGFGGNTENLRGRFGQLKGQIMQSTATPTNTQIQVFSLTAIEGSRELPGFFDAKRIVSVLTE